MAVSYWVAQQERDEEAVAGRRWRGLRRRTAAARGPLDASRAAGMPMDRCPGIAEVCSGHARTRLAQRCLSLPQLGYVLEHGTAVWRTGVLFYVLRRRDIEPADRRRDEVARLEGTVVLIDGGQIITVYRNRRGYHFIRTKRKYWRPRRGDVEALDEIIGLAA